LVNEQENIVGSLDRVYARALLDLAEEAGVVNGVSDELRQIEELLRGEPGLKRLVCGPGLSSEKKAGSLERIFKGRVSDLVYRFLRVVNGKDRLEALPGIIRGYVRLLDEKNGIVEADVFVATSLTDEQTQRVSAGLGRAIGGRVVLHPFVDPELIGGMKVRVGDQLYDGSVSTQLRLMRDQLVSAGREQSRVRLEKLIEM
jgi:F-type H+-transporting ATPase subunit delta